MKESKAYIVSPYDETSDAKTVVFEDLSEAIAYGDDSDELLWVDTAAFQPSKESLSLQCLARREIW